ncbi:YktB family protein [Jeotgalibacillus marinus]|uniref:UPF0637 protein AB1471_06520 n=1 Tax=Jeotgalibacillus marinus TaxID=86667 RepID=A0ABV3Q288_9BACL
MSTGFRQRDFDVFKIEGLDGRMEAIQKKIQPKFSSLGEELVPFLENQLEQEMYLHIARHARRTVNPPNDTWMAISSSKRGYKKLPHFQVGLWDDHLFIWLAFIYELPEKEKIAQSFIENFDGVIATIPQDGWISSDHMKKEGKKVSTMNEEDFLHVLERFQNVKKAELLIGKRLFPSDNIVMDQQALIVEIKSTYKKLLPLYRQSVLAQNK